jgi:hypothetical protein
VIFCLRSIRPITRHRWVLPMPPLCGSKRPPEAAGSRQPNGSVPAESIRKKNSQDAQNAFASEQAQLPRLERICYRRNSTLVTQRFMHPLTVT